VRAGAPAGTIAAMDAAALKAMQAPLTARYSDDPAAASITLRADGDLTGSGIAWSVRSGRAPAEAGCTRRPAALASVDRGGGLR
jgi:hypothetical protein